MQSKSWQENNSREFGGPGGLEEEAPASVATTPVKLA